MYPGFDDGSVGFFKFAGWGMGVDMNNPADVAANLTS
jgi:hypothetical protein